MENRGYGGASIKIDSERIVEQVVEEAVEGIRGLSLVMKAIQVGCGAAPSERQP